jgi:hypothetical protein
VTWCPSFRSSAAIPATCSLTSCGRDHANGVTRQIRSPIGGTLAPDRPADPRDRIGSEAWGLSKIRLPSLDIPEAEKCRFSEADVLSKLFEPDLAALGYPPHSATQADGEHFLEQGGLAVNRLKIGAGSGFFDGLYLIGNAPVVLCELKRYDALDAPTDFERAKRQLIDYARSEDFAEQPPFLVLYSGNAARTRFFVRKTMSDPSLLGERE